MNNEIKQKLTALNEPWRDRHTAVISLIRKYYSQLELIYILRNSLRIVVTSSGIHFQIVQALTKLGKGI